MFIITLKKRDLKESNRSGTSAENVAKAQKAFTQYEFIHWLDDFLAIRQGKNNLPVRDQFKEDEDKQSLHDEGNLVMPPDITPISELIEEDIEDTEQGFTFNTQKVSKRVSKIVQKSKNKRQGIKGARGDDLLDDMEFSLLRTFLIPERKEKPRKKLQKIYFVNLWLLT